MSSSYVSSEKTLSLYSHWERAKSIAGFWDVIICNKMSTLCSQWEGARFGLYPTKIFIKIKQASRRLKRLACRMTMLTVMTLNPGYGIGISSKQRHKRHLRHYRHARTARGSGDSPEMRLWISKRYACKTCLPLKRWQTNPIPAQIRICAQKWITSDSSKNLDTKKWISSDSLCTNKWKSTFH